MLPTRSGRALALAALVAVVPAVSHAFERIENRETFVNTVAGKRLQLAMFGITLEVKPDGEIAGEAMGWAVTGSWEWRDGYFCREMDWSGYEIAPNCQLVEANGRSMRFTSDQGAGRSASFRLR